MLAFIYTLDHPEMVGVNPEVAHEQMPGLDFSHGVGQALEAGKLFHIDLNGQKPGRYDQDLRFASEDQKGAFFLVKLLEDARWDGMRHFDSHAYRTEDEQGVWDFAYASMRSYNILKEKVAKFHADPEIREILRSLEQRGTTRGGGRGPGREIRPRVGDGAQGTHLRRGQAGGPRIRLRTAGSAHHRSSARRPLVLRQRVPVARRQFLGLDIGTSSVKACLVDGAGPHHRARQRTAAPARPTARLGGAGPGRLVEGGAARAASA